MSAAGISVQQCEVLEIGPGVNLLNTAPSSNEQSRRFDVYRASIIPLVYVGAIQVIMYVAERERAEPFAYIKIRRYSG